MPCRLRQGIIFYAQGRVRKLAAVQHAPRAESREKSFPARLHTGTRRKVVSKADGCPAQE